MEVQTGKTLTVSAKSQKGHSRIGKSGDQWLILDRKRMVHFDSRLGDWLFLKSIQDGDLCWMILNQDAHFVALELK